MLFILLDYVILKIMVICFQEWDAKAAKLKEEYNQAMKEYKSTAGASSDKSKKKDSVNKKAKEKAQSSPSKAGSGGSFISKEFIEDSDSESSDDSSPKKENKDAKPKVMI